jgi:hypothetical protein
VVSRQREHRVRPTERREEGSGDPSWQPVEPAGRIHEECQRRRRRRRRAHALCLDPRACLEREGERAVACFLAAVLTEIYLCASCSCHEILRSARPGSEGRLLRSAQPGRGGDLAPLRLPPVPTGGAGHGGRGRSAGGASRDWRSWPPRRCRGRHAGASGLPHHVNKHRLSTQLTDTVLI